MKFVNINTFALLFFSLAVIQPVFSLETHTVLKGETLYSLARQYDVTVKELAEINHLKSDAHIKTGQKLVIPDKSDSQASSSSLPAVHIVQKGETLYAIASKYHISIEEIAKKNQLNNNLIYVGQKLKLGSNTASKSESTSRVKETQEIVENKKTAPFSVQKSLTDSAKKEKAVIAAAPQKDISSPPLLQKKKVVSSNHKWPVSGEVYYFRGKIPGIEIDVTGKKDVVSVCNGTIKTASSFRGYGHVVVVEAYNNLLYTYAGFDSIVVQEGDTVKAGEKLGEMNSEHSSGDPKIYLFVYENGTAVNPVSVPRF